MRCYAEQSETRKSKQCGDSEACFLEASGDDSVEIVPGYFEHNDTGARGKLGPHMGYVIEDPELASIRNYSNIRS